METRQITKEKKQESGSRVKRAAIRGNGTSMVAVPPIWKKNDQAPQAEMAEGMRKPVMAASLGFRHKAREIIPAVKYIK
jgi:hypothetical protein